MNDVTKIDPGARRPMVSAAWMLVVLTFLWALSFPLTKNWQNAAHGCPGGSVLAGLTLIALRMIVAFALFSLFRPRLVSALSWRDVRIGFVIGLANFSGFAPQVIGLDTTTPALNAFFTSLGSAWVPLIAFLVFRHRVPLVTLLGLVLGIAGTAVLGMKGEEGWSMTGGDWLSLLSSLLFAVEILLIDRLGRRVAPGHLTAGFMLGTGLPALASTVVVAAAGPGLPAWTSWIEEMLRNPAILRDFCLLTIFCTALTSHWLVVYQPRVPAGRAVLIYLLEPVFAALLSIAWGHDTLTLYLVAGGSLILCGNLLAELPGIVVYVSRSRRPDSAILGQSR